MSAPAKPTSSIAKKLLMAVTGLLFLGFLTMHLAANLLMFVSPDAYNLYSHKLTSNPLIYVAEAALVLIFVGHAISGIRVWLENRKARPAGYERQDYVGESTISSRTMIYTGVLIFLFVVFHLISFKYGTHVTSIDGHRDLYSLVVYKFSQPLYSLFYILMMIALAFHLMHALNSALQTIGVRLPRYRKCFRHLSVAVGLFFGVGFASFPAWYWLRQDHYQVYIERVKEAEQLQARAKALDATMPKTSDKTP